jgi:tRNA (guanine37-N1)-methyltransferase
VTVRFDVVTLFPDLFGPHLTLGVTQRAFSSKQVDVRLWPLRDHAEGNYRRVDDRPYGGGPGMVLLAAPLLKAVAAVFDDRGAPCEVLMFTPSGEPLTQQLVQELATGEGAVLVCGRYEGVDQRFIDSTVTRQVSLGDYVLSGGELPALVLLDAVARLQEGVLSSGSARLESFTFGLLEGPCYSRPEVLTLGDRAHRVPAPLTSGNHAQIERFQRQLSLTTTARVRPDLIHAARQAGLLDPEDEAHLSSLKL